LIFFINTFIITIIYLILFLIGKPLYKKNYINIEADVNNFFKEYPFVLLDSQENNENNLVKNENNLVNNENNLTK
jgi:uncharacterized membrane protein YgaE (UPF0421/DUF939 family)